MAGSEPVESGGIERQGNQYAGAKRDEGEIKHEEPRDLRLMQWTRHPSNCHRESCRAA